MCACVCVCFVYMSRMMCVVSNGVKHSCLFVEYPFVDLP